MRKLILTSLVLALGTVVFAQDFKDVQEKINKEKYSEAREKIDKMSADAKAVAAPEYWYLRAKVYSNLAKATPDSVLMAESITAIQKYWDMEKGKEASKRGLKSVLDNHQAAFDVYTNYFGAGVKAFQTENWVSSAYNFGKALETFDLLRTNDLTKAKFDTTSTLYAGYAAQNGRLPETAVKYYTQIADRKIADSNYIGVYEYLVNYYLMKQDAANAQKYMTLGKTLYPNSKTWANLELASLDKDKSKKLAKLAEMTQQDQQNYNLWLEYTYELFNYVYGKDKPADYTAKQGDLTTTIKHLIEIDAAQPYGNYIMAQHVNNVLYDRQMDYAAVKGTTPADIKKKNDMNKEIAAMYEDLYKYAFAASTSFEKMSELKAAEKANYRNVLTQLGDYYRYKKQPEKAKLVDEKAKAIK